MDLLVCLGVVNRDQRRAHVLDVHAAPFACATRNDVDPVRRLEVLVHPLLACRLVAQVWDEIPVDATQAVVGLQLEAYRLKMKLCILERVADVHHDRLERIDDIVQVLDLFPRRLRMVAREDGRAALWACQELDEIEMTVGNLEIRLALYDVREKESAEDVEVNLGLQRPSDERLRLLLRLLLV